MAIIDNYDSTSSTDSLSARCGNDLNTRLLSVEFDLLDVKDDVSGIKTIISTLQSIVNKTILW